MFLIAFPTIMTLALVDFTEAQWSCGEDGDDCMLEDHALLQTGVQRTSKCLQPTDESCLIYPSGVGAKCCAALNTPPPDLWFPWNNQDFCAACGSSTNPRVAIAHSEVCWPAQQVVLAQKSWRSGPQLLQHLRHTERLSLKTPAASANVCQHEREDCAVRFISQTLPVQVDSEILFKHVSPSCCPKLDALLHLLPPSLLKYEAQDNAEASLNDDAPVVAEFCRACGDVSNPDVVWWLEYVCSNSTEAA